MNPKENESLGAVVFFVVILKNFEFVVFPTAFFSMENPFFCYYFVLFVCFLYRFVPLLKWIALFHFLSWTQTAFGIKRSHFFSLKHRQVKIQTKEKKGEEKETISTKWNEHNIWCSVINENKICWYIENQLE